MANSRKEYYHQYYIEHPEKKDQYIRRTYIKYLTSHGYFVTPRSDHKYEELIIVTQSLKQYASTLSSDQSETLLKAAQVLDKILDENRGKVLHG